MTVVGIWLAIVGYGLAYAGAVTIGGGTCGLLDGFRGKCQPGTKTASTTAGASGATLLQQQQAAQAQQAGLIPNAPIPQGATSA
jgi:hypothetical protein